MPVRNSIWSAYVKSDHSKSLKESVRAIVFVLVHASLIVHLVSSGTKVFPIKGIIIGELRTTGLPLQNLALLAEVNEKYDFPSLLNHCWGALLHMCHLVSHWSCVASHQKKVPTAVRGCIWKGSREFRPNHAKEASMLSKEPSVVQFCVIRHNDEQFSFLPPSFVEENHGPAVPDQQKSPLHEVLSFGGNWLHFQSRWNSFPQHRWISHRWLLHCMTRKSHYRHASANTHQQ